MNRLGLTYEKDLSPPAKALYDKISQYTDDHYGVAHITYKLADGRLVGPFGAQLHTPAVGEAFVAFAKALRDIPGFDARYREISIITVGAQEGASYELYAHTILARDAGLTEDEIEQMHNGKRPETFTDEQSKVAFDITRVLTSTSGVLSDEHWKKTLDAFGKDGATALVQTVGFYRYVSTILRGFDVKVPSPEERIENR